MLNILKIWKCWDVGCLDWEFGRILFRFWLMCVDLRMFVCIIYCICNGASQIRVANFLIGIIFSILFLPIFQNHKSNLKNCKSLKTKNLEELSKVTDIIRKLSYRNLCFVGIFYPKISMSEIFIKIQNSTTQQSYQISEFYFFRYQQQRKKTLSSLYGCCVHNFK